MLAFASFPPPVTGQSLVTAHVVEVLRETATVEVVDTSSRHGVWRRPGSLPAGRLREWLGMLDVLRRHVRAAPPDVVYVTPASTKWGLVRDALTLALLPKEVPVVAHVHVGDYGRLLRRPAWGALARWAAGGYDQIVFPSEYSARRLSEGFPSRRVAVVPYCIRPEIRFGPADVDAAWERRRAHAPMILSLSNAIPGKGLHVLADALAALRRRGVELTAVFAGGWPSPKDREAFGRQLGALGLAGAAHVEGAVGAGRVRELLRRASVLAFPSTYPHESFGLALLEGMGAGCAAVATDHAAAGTLVRDGVDGRLVTYPVHGSGYADALADALGDAIQRREQYGRAGAERARTAFAPEAFERRIVETILSAARPTAAPPRQ